MKTGTKVVHPRYGRGRIVGAAFSPLVRLVHFDSQRPGYAKVVRVAQLRGSRSRFVDTNTDYIRFSR